jgi:phage gp46-like protein
MKSQFPGFLDTAVVIDSDVSRGRKFLIEALQPLITKKIAKTIDVEGEIISVYGIAWTIYITKYDGTDSRFSITWEKGTVIFEAS